MDATQCQFARFAFDARDHQPHFGRATDAALERRRTEARDAMISVATDLPLKKIRSRIGLN
jgi:hypothetical protein